MSFSGILGGGWHYAVTYTTKGGLKAVSDWLSAIDRLPEIHERLRRVQVECDDWLNTD